MDYYFNGTRFVQLCRQLPAGVTQEQALSHPEVQERLSAAIHTLKTTAIQFLQRIIQSKQLIPFGLLFIAKELKAALNQKFPDSHEKEVLKVRC